MRVLLFLGSLLLLGCPPYQPSLSDDLYGVWGLNMNSLWAVGAHGTTRSWDGTNWPLTTSGTSSSLGGIWGVDANNIWAVGFDGLILKWDGKSWSSQASSTGSMLFSVWGTDANNVWAVGSGAIVKWDGTSSTASSV
jgi:hypothetical protein